MDKIILVNRVIKDSVINFCIYIIFIKIINYRSNSKMKNIIMFAIGFLEAITEQVLIFIPTPFKIIGLGIIYGASISVIIKDKFKHSVIITFLSLAIEYIIFILSTTIAAIVLGALKDFIPINSSISLVVIVIINILLIKGLFNIKRFKNGIEFLKNDKVMNNIGILGVIIVSIVLLIYSIFNENRDKIFIVYLLVGIFTLSVCLFIWLKRKITVYYRQRLKERTVEELESEIRARDERICEVVDENSRLAEVNHKFSSRIRALEDFSCKMIERPEIAELMRCEFGNEFADFEEAVKNVSEEFSSEMKHTVIIRKKLPKTGVFGVDNLLEYMCKESAKNGIDFDVKINGNILFMVQKIIDSKMLETLLGDHIKDAIIAINSSQNTYKNILVTIGIVKECYEISIYDTGIEFEIDTLLKLGLERITTHKSTGGSGIGFMTTFETLAKTKASLIIEEKHPITNNDYTKIVRIRFDGKKEYRIKSYRQNEIEGRKVDKRIKFEKT